MRLQTLCACVLPSGAVADILQEAKIPLIAQSVCSSPTVYGSIITNRMLCAGFPEGKVDACQVTGLQFIF